MSKLHFSKNEKTDDNNNEKEPWIILVADDEGDVHMVTKMVLDNFHFDERPVQILNSFTGKETLELLVKYPKTAVLLLDVVMES